jgi:opacity protein-like surface antigen
MKITKLNLIALTFAVFAALSTITYSQSIGLGLESGLNIANASISPININSSSRTGFMVGGFADIGMSRIISIRPGIRYVTKGFSIDQGQGTMLTHKLNYLEIPMLLKAGIPLRQVVPYFMAGPTLGIQLSATAEVNNAAQVQTVDVGTSYETIDIGLLFGSGLEFNVGNNIDVFTGFSYSLGLSNNYKINNVSIKNYGLQITGGVKFGL